MTQSSRPVAGRLTDFPNSDCGPYTGPQWREVYSTLFTRDPTTMGPLRGIDNELEVVVTNAVAENIRVRTGAGICNGALLLNDANVNFSSAPSGTVVMVLNATNAAYNTNLTFPDDTTDYGVGPSVEAYTCRLAICTSSLIQNNSIWMIPLATYSGGNNLVDDRTFCEYADASLPSAEEITATMIEDRTRRILVPHVGGYLGTTPCDTHTDPYTGGALINIGFRFSKNCGNASAYTEWMVPSDFVSGLQAIPVWNSYFGAGTFRVYARVYYGSIGQGFQTHSTTWGPVSWACANGNRLTEMHTLNLVDAVVGDILHLELIRYGGHGDDTGPTFAYSPGWILEYIADS